MHHVGEAPRVQRRCRFRERVRQSAEFYSVVFSQVIRKLRRSNLSAPPSPLDGQVVGQLGGRLKHPPH
jgi:hypothetical protein